jgi:zinc protease
MQPTGGQVLSDERLPNGLRLIVEPRGAAPVVALWLRLEVGALRERPGQEGAAHFVEHMLFKGCRAPGDHGGLGPGEIGPIMDALGADLNAYTSHEETVLHCVLPKEHAERALGLMGQLVFRSWFDPEQVRRERDVVLDELLRGRDDPSRQLADGMSRRIWGTHPYGRSVLGTLPSVRDMAVESLRAFHQRWYHPANAHLVVVGDIDPATVRRVASSEAFEPRADAGSWRGPGAIAPPPAPQRSLRFVRVAGNFEEQILELSLRIPGHGHPDLPAIDMLCSVLGEGASAVLPHHLHVERGVAHSAWAITEVGSLAGQLVCGASPSSEDPADALEAIGEALRDLRHSGVPVQAFQRAKAAILADRAYSDESAEGRASVLSFYLGNYGSAGAERGYRGKIEALRLRDVERVASTWLRLDRATVGIVGPDPTLGLREAERRLLPRAPGRHPGRSRPQQPVQRRVLSNGLRLLVEPLPEASVTSLRVVGYGGTLLEAPETAGHGRAWADLLTEGCGHLDAGAFAQAIEGLSGSMGGFSSLSIAGMSASFPSDRFGVALHLLLLPLLQPRFDDDAVDRVRAGMLDAVRTRADSGAAMAWEALLGLAFPGHPYRLSSVGSERSVERVDAASMARYHRRVVRAGNLVVAISGAVSPEDVFRSLERILGQIPAGRAQLPSAPHERTIRRRRRELRGGWQQAQIMVGFRGAPVHHPDRPALDVLGTLLGSAGGRLFLQLREEAGLTYDVQAHHLAAIQGGLLTCAMGTAPGRLAEADRALWQSLDELRHEPPGPEELERAVSALSGAAAMDLQRSSYRAMRVAQDELFDLDGRRFLANLDDVRRVTLADLHRVTARYLDPRLALRVSARRG